MYTLLFIWNKKRRQWKFQGYLSTYHYRLYKELSKYPGFNINNLNVADRSPFVRQLRQLHGILTHHRYVCKAVIHTDSNVPHFGTKHGKACFKFYELQILGKCPLPNLAHAGDVWAF